MPALCVTVVVFVAGALGLLAYKVDYSTTSFFKKSVDSVEGFKVLGEAFPQGTLAPMTVLVTNENGPVTEAEVSDGDRPGRGRWRASPAPRRPASPRTTATPPRSRSCSRTTRSKSSSLEIVPDLRDRVGDLGRA